MFALLFYWAVCTLIALGMWCESSDSVWVMLGLCLCSPVLVPVVIGTVLFKLM